MLVVQTNNEGVPFVLANPARADQPGHHRVAGELLTAGARQRPVAAGRR